MKILIVDDETLIREVIKEYATLENFIVDEAENGLNALEKVQNNEYDVIILDIMMPKMDGFTFFQKLKEIKNIPTIILSARSDEYDKLLGFDMGIDDYVTKPFSPKELIARIKAVTKRNKKEYDKFIYKDLIVDFKGHEVTIKSKPLKITPKEYDILIYFIKNKNIAISREQLLTNIWGYDYFGEDRTIDTHIKMLRNNLGEYRNLITTVRGVGYKFNVQES